MPATTLQPYTKQPLHKVIKERRLTFPAVAHAINVDVAALRNVAYGFVYPTEVMLRELPKYFDTPIDDLFEPRVLAGPPARTRKRAVTVGTGK